MCNSQTARERSKGCFWDVVRVCVCLYFFYKKALQVHLGFQEHGCSRFGSAGLRKIYTDQG